MGGTAQADAKSGARAAADGCTPLILSGFSLVARGVTLLRICCRRPYVRLIMRWLLPVVAIVLVGCSSGGGSSKSGGARETSPASGRPVALKFASSENSE